MRSKRIRGRVLAVIVFSITILPSTSVHATIPTFCPSPSQVGFDWRQEVPNAECLAGEGAKVCRAWVSTCKKVVRATAKCQVTQGASATKLEKARCKLATVLDPKQCKQSAKNTLKLAKARAKSSRDFGLQDCVDHFDQCVATCEN